MSCPLSYKPFDSVSPELITYEVRAYKTQMIFGIKTAHPSFQRQSIAVKSDLALQKRIDIFDMSPPHVDSCLSQLETFAQTDHKKMIAFLSPIYFIRCF